MKPDYIGDLIQAISNIIAALIGGWFAVRANSKTQPTKNKKWPSWLLFLTGAVIGVVVYQGAILVPNSISGLFANKYIERNLVISATKEWQASGIFVSEGNSIELVARNEKWSPRADSSGNASWTDADGTGKNTYFSNIGLNASLGSLIAKIGEGPPFVVGKNSEFNANTNGVLFFRIHDENLADNLGSIIIRVRIWR
jgi:hypothetical protein